MSYRNGKSFLESKTSLIELYDEFGARVAVCPEWNGRVMTSSCEGIDGESFGLIRVNEIETTNFRSEFLAFGGEEQFCLSPLNGPLGLLYTEEEAAGIIPKYPIEGDDPCNIPQGYHEAPFEVDTAPFDPSIRMRRSIRMVNLAGHLFDLNVVRTVRLLNIEEIEKCFGGGVAAALDQESVSMVAYETSSTVINRGEHLLRENGLFSIRTRCMYNAGPHTVAFMPIRSDPEFVGSELSYDYYGTSPHGVFRKSENCLMLRADGKHRGSVSVPPPRAVRFFGAINYRSGRLTIIRYNLAEKPASNMYMNDLPNGNSDPDPYDGGVLQLYNSGPPPAPGKKTDVADPYFSFDIHSPAKELQRGESVVHRQVTLHVNAEKKTLEFLLRKTLKADYETVYNMMIH